MEEVAGLLETLPESLAEDDLAGKLFEVMKGHGLTAKQFFPDVYTALIGKPNGPKLASFLKAMGIPRAVKILRRAL